MDTNTTVSQIATQIPGSTRIFRAHNIDFCCGGNRPLAEACGEKTESILAEIAALTPSPSDTLWANASNADLITHIVEYYHRKHQRDLPECIILATKVEAVHADKETCPKGLADQLRKMHLEMEEHMSKEEMILFPAILNAADPNWLANPIRVMRDDHEGLGADMAALRKLTNAFTPPEEACNTWRALYLGVKTLCEDLTEHVHLENNILFPKVTGEWKTA